jgi:hypothetical protein
MDHHARHRLPLHPGVAIPGMLGLLVVIVELAKTSV